jgi:hypothetical protein
MQENKDTTKLVQPQPEGKTRMVRIKAKQPIRLADGKHIAEGAVVDVSEEEAAEFCDRSFDGYYAFAGERFNDKTKHKVVRAERVKN